MGVVLKSKDSVFYKRNEDVDCMKGILIVLVVLGHTYNEFCNNFIYLFHVGLFFILSGYCFNQKYTESFASLWILFKKRIKSLWIPYVAYNFVFLLLQNVFLKIGLLTSRDEYFSFNPFLPDGYCQAVTVKSAVVHIMKSFFFMNSRPFVGGLWFLGGLFYITMGYAAIQFVLKKLSAEKFHIGISVLLLVMGWLLSIVGFMKNIPMLKQMCIIFITEILFTIGTYIKLYAKVEEYSFPYFIIGFIYFATVCYFLSLQGTVSIATVHILNPWFYIVGILSGGGICIVCQNSFYLQE